MSIIYVLIPIAMLFVAIAVAVFFWAVKSEQFDDLDRQSVSILFDDDVKKSAANPATPLVNQDIQDAAANLAADNAKIQISIDGKAPKRD
jgi:cbb3-type cytochrome oxidase maturation protein